MNKRRDFLKKAGAASVAAVGATTLSAPHVRAQSKTPIKWRLQTYAGPALAEHVIKPSIDAFNKVANGDMVIELYFADQLVPTGELFRAMQRGTIDAVQSDDVSIAAPGEATSDLAIAAGRSALLEAGLAPDELEFINAINAYKTAHSRPFPTWSEVLHVLHALGYRKSGRSGTGA